MKDDRLQGPGFKIWVFGVQRFRHLAQLQKGFSFRRVST